jgi:hypothetical protein
MYLCFFKRASEREAIIIYRRRHQGRRGWGEEAGEVTFGRASWQGSELLRSSSV